MIFYWDVNKKQLISSRNVGDILSFYAMNELKTCNVLETSYMYLFIHEYIIIYFLV